MVDLKCGTANQACSLFLGGGLYFLAFQHFLGPPYEGKYLNIHAPCLSFQPGCKFLDENLSLEDLPVRQIVSGGGGGHGRDDQHGQG